MRTMHAPFGMWKFSSVTGPGWQHWLPACTLTPPVVDGHGPLAITTPLDGGAPGTDLRFPLRKSLRSGKGEHL